MSEKVVHKFDSTNPDSMREAARIATELANKLEGKSTVQESQETEKEDVELIKSERDTYKNMLDLVAQKEFEKKKAQLNAPDSITTVEELKAFSEGKKANQPQKINAGCVPLETQTPARQEGFSSVEQMIDAVSDNKEITQKLLHKTLCGIRDGKLSLPSYEEPIPECTTSDLSPDLKLSKHPDVLGIQARYRKKKLLERQKRTTVS